MMKKESKWSMWKSDEKLSGKRKKSISSLCMCVYVCAYLTAIADMNCDDSVSQVNILIDFLLPLPKKKIQKRRTKRQDMGKSNRIR